MAQQAPGQVDFAGRALPVDGRVVQEVPPHTADAVGAVVAESAPFQLLGADVALLIAALVQEVAHIAV